MDLSVDSDLKPMSFPEAVVDNPYAIPLRYMDVPIQHMCSPIVSRATAPSRR